MKKACGGLTLCFSLSLDFSESRPQIRDLRAGDYRKHKVRDGIMFPKFICRSPDFGNVFENGAFKEVIMVK